MGTTSVVRVPGDYQIVTSTGGVVIDVQNTGTQHNATSGTVTIYGNLDVIGAQTYIESTTTNILDNIIFLNAGETNNYITLGTAGIAISRGSVTTTTNAATMLYDDNASWKYDNVTTTKGVWELAVSTPATGRRPSALRINAIRVGATESFLNFLGQENPSAVLNVRGTTDYERQVLDDDDIPNKKYVDDRFFIGNELARKLKVGNTQVMINDNSVAPSDPYYATSNKIIASLGTTTNVVLQLEGQQAFFSGIVLNNNEIKSTGANSPDLILTSQSSGTVIVNSGIELTYTLPPKNVNNHSINIHSTSTIGGGGTGLYFVNSSRGDELVSRKRAIIYGIIF
jgi:hypothetical protein